METQNQTTLQQPTYVVVNAPKSVAMAIILTFIFGPLGLLYSSIKGGIIMFFVTFIIGFFTLGFGLLLTWPLCIIWAAVAARNSQKHIR
ncbi:MAG: hypothetical protein ABI855_18875 [Bacteroidota bacterium]